MIRATQVLSHNGVPGEMGIQLGRSYSSTPSHPKFSSSPLILPGRAVELYPGLAFLPPGGRQDVYYKGDQA